MNPMSFDLWFSWRSLFADPDLVLCMEEAWNARQPEVDELTQKLSQSVEDANWQIGNLLSDLKVANEKNAKLVAKIAELDQIGHKGLVEAFDRERARADKLQGLVDEIAGWIRESDSGSSLPMMFWCSGGLLDRLLAAATKRESMEEHR